MSSSTKYMAKLLKNFYIYIRKIYHMLKFLKPHLKLDAVLCLWFDPEYQRFALHVT